MPAGVVEPRVTLALQGLPSGLFFRQISQVRSRSLCSPSAKAGVHGLNDIASAKAQSVFHMVGHIERLLGHIASPAFLLKSISKGGEMACASLC